MKLLSQIHKILSENNFDVEFESQMVQSRIISTFLEVIEDKKLTQLDLENLTGLSQPFISGLINNRKKLNVEHIARFQHALEIILQSPTFLTTEEHSRKYYNADKYENNEFISEYNEINNFKISFKTLVNCYETKFKNDNIKEFPLLNKAEKDIFDYA